MKKPERGDYVIGWTGSSGDPWSIGWLGEPFEYAPERFNVIDINREPYRLNGYRHVRHLSRARGIWMLKHAKEIEGSYRSIPFFLRCKMD